MEAVCFAYECANEPSLLEGVGSSLTPVGIVWHSYQNTAQNVFSWSEKKLNKLSYKSSTEKCVLIEIFITKKANTGRLQLKTTIGPRILFERC